MWIATKKLKVSEMTWILVGDDMVVSRDDVDMLKLIVTSTSKSQYHIKRIALTLRIKNRVS